MASTNVPSAKAVLVVERARHHLNRLQQRTVPPPAAMMDVITGAWTAQAVAAAADLGIADAVNAKAKLGKGGLTGEFIVKGEADLAVQQLPELKSVPGIDIVGPLPDRLQSITLLSAGVLAGTHAEAGFHRVRRPGHQFRIRLAKVHPTILQECGAI